MSQPTPATGVVMNVASAPGFHCKLEHGPSGTKITTEAPKDNGGTGMSFSPTDLVGAALASCALTTMALAASREGIPFGDARARVEKRMTPPPRRIGELVLEIDMPAGLSAAHRARLEEVAHGCPVTRSLHPDVKIPLTFRYPDEAR
ncbi:OsmC family protein [Archangium violaceum]|uniref:Osmotically inducible protein OsmC n=1 Tax=Archangium violaceum Cb vi76 TaxID=1406225 RepID=A0A084SLC9_9BACT|nr:OsmC family protein [Archangium violaceum]KFA89264.1 osmotically inducible protein OsmC [Archangium violaceum Cb vi76]WNG59215.1 OsmC family protein [Archangium gephyra]WPB80843.1 OsmC family protein [Archangium gephyra]